MGTMLQNAKKKKTVVYRRLLRLFGSALIGYWPLWETSAGVIQDVAGQNYSGSYYGTMSPADGIGPNNRPAPRTRQNDSV